MHHALEQAFPDRFLLGIGISHQRAVEGAGITYEKPLRKLRTYLDELDAAPNPVPVDERILASLGPLSLKLARDRSVGTHPYFMPVEHTRISREAVGPGKIVAPEQMVVLETDADRARTIARAAADRYLHAPNYVNNLLRLGFTDDDIANGGSERLIDALIAWGEPSPSPSASPSTTPRAPTTSASRCSPRHRVTWTRPWLAGASWPRALTPLARCSRGRRRAGVVDFVAAARALAPRHRGARRTRSSSDRAIPRDLVDALIDAGMFRLMLPALAGRRGARAADVRASRRGAGARGRERGLVRRPGERPVQLHCVCRPRRPHGLSLRAGGRSWPMGPGEGNRPGRAEPVRGRLSGHGQWMFASGFPHATLAAGDLRRGFRLSSEPDQRLMLLPKPASRRTTCGTSAACAAPVVSHSLCKTSSCPFARAIRSRLETPGGIRAAVSLFE